MLQRAYLPSVSNQPDHMLCQSIWSGCVDGQNNSDLDYGDSICSVKRRLFLKHLNWFLAIWLPYLKSKGVKWCFFDNWGNQWELKSVLSLPASVFLIPLTQQYMENFQIETLEETRYLSEQQFTACSLHWLCILKICLPWFQCRCMSTAFCLGRNKCTREHNLPATQKMNENHSGEPSPMHWLF